MGYIHKRKERVIEGELRCEELLNYLEKLNAPKTIWLSEDASGVFAKVTHDPNTNQLVGLVLPTESKTGSPMLFSFTPHSIEYIEKQMKENSMSTLVFLVLAQPIMNKSPPFILQVFGTDNKFKTQDVMLRWQHTRDQLAR